MWFRREWGESVGLRFKVRNVPVGLRACSLCVAICFRCVGLVITTLTEVLVRLCGRVFRCCFFDATEWEGSTGLLCLHS